MCPHQCIIHPRRSGKCKVRTNRNGILYADTYACLSATNFDPIEKKPLYNFHPGAEIFSLGSLGCNFTCKCCQNYEIAQTGKAGFPRIQELTPEEIVKKALQNPASIGIAYTYNEPFVWYEYMYDIALLAKQKRLKNVAVSNGYINAKPLQNLLPLMDAFNIDLKTFDAKTYKEFTGGELPYVLHTLSSIYQAGKHLEITVLVIPGINDDQEQFDNMLHWIVEHLGKKVPLHLSRYFPHYRFNAPATPIELMLKMADRAREKLDYVYMGNVAADAYQNTYCPNCGLLVVRRQGYYVKVTGLNSQGRCAACNQRIMTNSMKS